MDLWVLPTPENSRWFASIDWHLNWQMCRGLAHSHPKLSENVMQLVAEHEIEVINPKVAASAPLMVISHNRLPADTCVVVPAQPAEKWLAKAHKIGESLGSKGIRVFLPSGLSKRDAEKVWQTFTPAIQVEFTADEEAT